MMRTRLNHWLVIFALVLSASLVRADNGKTTLTVAAYVRTLGLVELLFTFAVGRIAFRETPAPRELAGAALLAAGIALLLNAG